MRRTITLLAATALSIVAAAQGTIETDYLSASDMNDRDGANHGSGDMLRIKGRYTVPLRVSVNERRQPTAWTATLSASYAKLNNKGEALALNPDEILNSNLNISHTRPLSHRWQLIASLGAGVYSEPNEIAWQSVLVNGAAIFAYKFSDNLNAGFGLGLTNSYGVPMVMPMGYLDWRTNGNVKVKVNMASGLSVKASTMFGKTLGLELTAIDIDGMSAVRHKEGQTKIYSTMMMRSTLSPTVRLSPQTTLRLSVGGTWLRTVSESDRSLKSFFRNFGNDEDKSKHRFLPSLRFSIGLSYGL